MKVLSLFDGMSGAQVALQRAGIKVAEYHACEIDKYAIQIAQKNFPQTIQRGSVVGYQPDFKPDLLVGGSPCQGFSFASGGRLNFEDHRSKLFFEYARILKESKPKYFLLENVRMAKTSEQVITKMLGVEPREINSGLVSAQNRKRLYWTNIPFEMPVDKGLILSDILEDGYFKGGNLKSYFEKELVFSADGLCQVGIAEEINGHDILKRVYHPSGKSPTLNSMGGGNREPKVSIGKNYLHWRKLTPLECERCQTYPDNYSEGVSKTQRYKMLGNSFTVDVIATIFQGLLSAEREVGVEV
tara:strand:- start:3964 stop:4863 length:900 start_codon:yes stop_codon:yes gene_type:complete